MNVIVDMAPRIAFPAKPMDQASYVEWLRHPQRPALPSSGIHVQAAVH